MLSEKIVLIIEGMLNSEVAIDYDFTNVLERLIFCYSRALEAESNIPPKGKIKSNQ